jgi:SAM-dependent methyltransferase
MSLVAAAADGHDGQTMESYEYAKLAAFENRYWWHVGRRSIVERQIAKLNGNQRTLRILNVGSGTGGTVQVLAERGSVLNIDRSEEAVRLMRENGYEAFQMDGSHTPLRDGQFDLVAALDVLEHISEDDVALAEWARLLNPGGHILLTVPAYQWLWSGHDVSLGHFRRYSAKPLQKLVRAAGFEVRKCSYAITFSFFLIVVFRFCQRVFRPHVQTSSYVELPGVLNTLFIGLLRIEAFLLETCSFPFGSSILVVARKPATKVEPSVVADTHFSTVSTKESRRAAAACV